MGGALVKINEILCRHAQPCLLTEECSMVKPHFNECVARVFKLRALLLRWHTARQSVGLTIGFARR